LLPRRLPDSGTRPGAPTFAATTGKTERLCPTGRQRCAAGNIPSAPFQPRKCAAVHICGKAIRVYANVPCINGQQGSALRAYATAPCLRLVAGTLLVGLAMVAPLPPRASSSSSPPPFPCEDAQSESGGACQEASISREDYRRRLRMPRYVFHVKRDVVI